MFTRVVVMSLMLASINSVANEDIATNGPNNSFGGGGVVEIGAITNPSVLMDFDGVSTGPITVGGLQAAFPGSSLANIVQTPRALTGNYNFQDGSGQALGGNPDQSGDLVIVASGDDFGEIESTVISLNQPATQFGFGIGDWSGPFNAIFRSNGAEVGSIQVVTTTTGTAGGPGSEHFLESATPFDEIELTASPDNPAANWVIHFIQVEQGELLPPPPAVPTLNPFGLALLLLAMLAFGWLRQRRHSTPA